MMKTTQISRPTAMVPSWTACRRPYRARPAPAPSAVRRRASSREITPPPSLARWETRSRARVPRCSLQGAGPRDHLQLMGQLVQGDGVLDKLSGDVAAVQNDEPIDHGIHVEDVVIDKDAGFAGPLDSSDEVQRLPGLRDRQPHGWLVEDNELSLEIESAHNGDPLPLPCRVVSEQTDDLILADVEVDIA